MYSRLRLVGAGTRALNFTLGAIVIEFIVAEIPWAITEALGIIYGQDPGSLIFHARILREDAACYLIMHFILMGMFVFHIERIWGEQLRRRVLMEVAIIVVLLFLLDVASLVLSCTNDVIYTSSNVGSYLQLTHITADQDLTSYSL
jgi:hypothetical protein